ncbi:SDO1-like protein [Fulvia fulva]|uniref:SDO1-like protein n=1 Tax=Passalora fulva TaxID=5499 RepID=A0A9Q8UUN6_PASFU|nr:SDO1-like protein [Fulvia fulva]KAK4626646.1 SDO1-like protein [Fulvia fulva]KAK4628305.1 SDO1-like protein [Fulvia fulva]UJO23126.1 SDO1-like protein [Fulvia fulva]WPV13348.1 SDO1-like protein [Fulvia fulva]WPV28552.1 SDO1-like protein [Fulvia fulva]
MRGNDAQIKCHYKGKDEDFVVIVDSKQAVQDWKKSDNTLPLAQVVSGFKVFVTHKHGNQGVMDTASKGQLEDEFGTSNEDEVVKQILEKGSIIESGTSGRDGVKNDSKGAMAGH